MRLIRFVGLVYLLQAIVVVGAEKSGIVVTPVNISEMRSDIRGGAVMASGPIPDGWHGGLSLELKIEGADVREASSWRNLRIVEAIDDLGTSLLPPPKLFGEVKDPNEWTSFDLFRNDLTKAQAATLSVSLQPAPRRALRIVRLRGDVSVQAGGRKKTFRIDRLKSALGKDVQDPFLNAAGVQMSVEVPKDSDGNGKDLTVKLRGENTALRTVDVMDKTGLSLATPLSTLWQIHLDRPIDDKMILQVEVVVDQRTVRVPLDVRDLPLP